MPVPRFDVEVQVEDVDPDHLRLMFDDEVAEDSIGDNRLYFNIGGIDWPEVQSIVEAEEALVLGVSIVASDIDHFDELIDEAMDAAYPGEDIDEGPLSDLSLGPGLVFIAFGRTLSTQVEFGRRACIDNPNVPHNGAGKDLLPSRFVQRRLLCGGYYFVPPLERASRPWSWVV